jgi:CheY-like chemotaxis protein
MRYTPFRVGAQCHSVRRRHARAAARSRSRDWLDPASERTGIGAAGPRACFTHVRKDESRYLSAMALNCLGEGHVRMNRAIESEKADSERPSPLVLVVDDFEDNRAMYAEYLAYSGYCVEQAADGQEAVKLAQDLLPDVVVMDLSLPIMDGWEATRRLKADERTRRIPVIALTGHALASHSRGAQEAGCDAFLAKPCLPEKLVEKVEELIRPKS